MGSLTRDLPDCSLEPALASTTKRVILAKCEILYRRLREQDQGLDASDLASKLKLVTVGWSKLRGTYHLSRSMAELLSFITTLQLTYQFHPVVHPTAHIFLNNVLEHHLVAVQPWPRVSSFGSFTIIYSHLPQTLWSSGQSSWLQIQRSGFDFWRYQVFWKVVGLERGLLSIVSTTEELLERRSRGSGLENLKYGRRNPSRWPRGNLCQQKLALTSPTSGCRSIGIVRSQNKAEESKLPLGQCTRS
jgi:hypothetical protein